MKPIRQKKKIFANPQVDFLPPTEKISNIKAINPAG